MMQRNNKIIFCDMDIKDINAIKTIENECFSEPWSENSIINGLNDPNSHFVIAKCNDILIGYGGMYHACGEGYVYNIAVKKEYRKMGIGKALVENLCDYSIKHGLEFLSLEVRLSNEAAIGLYNKTGFISMGVRKNFYSKPCEDALIMTKYFKRTND